MDKVLHETNDFSDKICTFSQNIQSLSTYVDKRVTFVFFHIILQIL